MKAIIGASATFLLFIKMYRSTKLPDSSIQKGNGRDSTDFQLQTYIPLYM